MNDLQDINLIKAKVQKVICSHLDLCQSVIVLDKNLTTELKADHNDIVMIIISLEKLFSICVLDDDFDQLNTGNDIVRLIIQCELHSH